MPSYHHQHQHQQCFDSCSNHTRRGYSKAQICFFKILHIISSVPPSCHSVQQSSRTGGTAVDPNLQFCYVAEDAESEFQCSAENGSDSSAIEANGKKEETGDAGERSVRDSEETKMEEEIGVEKEGDEEEEKELGGVEDEYNCLDLLIEAAKVISGKEESKKIEEARRSEGKKRWMVVNLYSDDAAEKSPVVRTKRGRSQALPYRFRDSVMEPLKRTGRPHRPSSTTAASRKRLVGS